MKIQLPDGRKIFSILLAFAVALQLICVDISAVYAESSSPMTENNFPIEITFSTVGVNKEKCETSYSAETGYCVIVPAGNTDLNVKMETADPYVDEITAKIEYYQMEKEISKLHKNASLAINDDNGISLGKIFSTTSVANVTANLTITQGKTSKEYPITFKKNVGLGTLTVTTESSTPQISPSVSKNVYEYKVYGLKSSDSITIEAKPSWKNGKIKSADLQQSEYVGSLNWTGTLEWDADKTKTVKITTANSDATDGASPLEYKVVFYQRADSLEIETQPQKTEYYVGEAFDPKGMIVKGKYSDNSEQTIANYSISPKVFTEEGSQDVTISYGGQEATVTVSVKQVFEECGTIEEPYLISTQDDLIRLSATVGNGMSYYGKYFKMTSDLSLPTNWTTIGSESADGEYHNFCGSFDGDNHTLTIPAGEKPLFGYVAKAELKNLKIYGEKINGFGVVNNYRIGSSINFDNVILLEGTQTLKSGFIGGYASGADVIYITNCTIEKGVTIGYDGNESNIGSFGGDFNGKIINCKSSATVKGKDFVGGIVGNKGQTMKGSTSEPPEYHMINCQFDGEVIATGNYVGGIAGGGYGGTLWGIASAPNTPCSVIQDCIVTGSVTGGNYVGGILGAEPGVVQCWENGIGYIQNNLFIGTVKATNGNYTGAIIGYMNSLNKYNVISNNYFSESCGSKVGIGGVALIDTDYKKPDKSDKNIKYVDTSIEVPIGENKIVGLTKSNHNRNDDPMGTDAGDLAKAASDSELKDESIVKLLNNAENGTHRWIQGKTYPEQSNEPIMYKLTINNISDKTYYLGDVLDTENWEITGHYSDGTTKSLSLGDVVIEGFDSEEIGVKTVKVKNGIAEANFEVTVLSKNPQSVNAYITIYGDSVHDSDEDGLVHTLSKGNLPKIWVIRTPVSLTQNNTVKDALEKVAADNGITIQTDPASKYGYYVEGMTKDGTYIGEFTNGRLSGWMYTVNGTHPAFSAEYYFLKAGDEIVWHYTDDYTVEEGSDKWTTAGAVEEVKEVTTDKTAGTTTSSTDVKVSETTNADGTKESVATVTVSAENQKEILAQAKSNKSKEIILQVSKDSVKDATKADVQLDKSFIESVLKDTEAKLTVKTPFGDKTYTQDELKALAAAATGKTVSLKIVKSEKTDEELKAEQLEAAKAAVAKASMKARSTKTSKGNVKVVFKPDTKTQNFIQEMKDMGYTVKYRFYRSTKKSSGYKAMLTKTSKTYTNTSGKAGTRYYYKVQVRVYDENGKCVAKTALKQCKYATRIFG